MELKDRAEKIDSSELERKFGTNGLEIKKTFIKFAETILAGFRLWKRSGNSLEICEDAATIFKNTKDFCQNIFELFKKNQILSANAIEMANKLSDNNAGSQESYLDKVKSFFESLDYGHLGTAIAGIVIVSIVLVKCFK